MANLIPQAYKPLFPHRLGYLRHQGHHSVAPDRPLNSQHQSPGKGPARHLTIRCLAATLSLLVCYSASAHGPEDGHAHEQDEPAVSTAKNNGLADALLPQYTPSGPDLMALTQNADEVLVGTVIKQQKLSSQQTALTLDQQGKLVTILMALASSPSQQPGAAEDWAIWGQYQAPNDYQRQLTTNIQTEVRYAIHRHRGQLKLQNPQDAKLLAEFLALVGKPEQTRDATFLVLGSGNPGLIEDGIRQLYNHHEQPAPLSATELTAVRSALKTPGPFRQALLGWLAKQPNGDEALRDFSPNTGSELLAWLQARKGAGMAAQPNELLAYSQLPNPSFQAAALTVLAQCNCPQASYALLPQIVDSRDQRLQRHGIELAPTLGEPALPYLATATLDRNIRIKKSAGKAITRIGGENAGKTLYALATSNQDSLEAKSAKQFAANTLYMWLGPDHAIIARLSATPEGKRLLEEVRENPLPIRVLH